jgi:H3 lysine-79-specific histone-lysine N-methyltransferase
MPFKATESHLTKTRCSKKLIKYLMSLIYNRAVQEPGKLNQYEPFSPEVYGETGFDIIDQMLNRVPLTDNDIFIDLGSGKIYFYVFKN